MFSQACVILFTGEWSGQEGWSGRSEVVWSGGGVGCGLPPLRKWETPLPKRKYGQWAVGTHPTGMHSCFFLFFWNSFN